MGEEIRLKRLMFHCINSLGVEASFHHRCGHHTLVLQRLVQDGQRDCDPGRQLSLRERGGLMLASDFVFVIIEH